MLAVCMVQNNLVCIVRAHEVQSEGYRRHFEPALVAQRSQLISLQTSGQTTSNATSTDGDGMLSTQTKAEKVSAELHVESFPPVITVFSAPNYCDRYENKGAVLRVDSALQGFEFVQYRSVEHPQPLVLAQSEAELHLKAVIAQCPYMPTSFDKFVSHALALGLAQIEIAEEEKEAEGRDDTDGAVGVNAQPGTTSSTGTSGSPSNQFLAMNLSISVGSNSTSAASSTHITPTNFEVNGSVDGSPRVGGSTTPPRSNGQWSHKSTVSDSLSRTTSGHGGGDNNHSPLAASFIAYASGSTSFRSPKHNVASAKAGARGIFKGVEPSTPIRGSQRMGLLQLQPDEVAMIDPLNIFSPTASRPLQAHVFERHETPVKVPAPGAAGEESPAPNPVTNPLMRPNKDGSVTSNSISSFVKSGYALFKRTVSITRPPLSVFQITSPGPGGARSNVSVESDYQINSPGPHRHSSGGGGTGGRVGNGGALFQSPKARQRQGVPSSLFAAQVALTDSDASEGEDTSRASGGSAADVISPRSEVSTTLVDEGIATTANESAVRNPLLVSPTGSGSVIVPVTPPPPPPTGSVVSYVAIPSPVPSDSAAFVQASASDAINEIHPRRLERVFKGNHWLQKPKSVREVETGSYAASVNKMFELDATPEKTFSVKELRQRYERSAAGVTGSGAAGELIMFTPTKGAKARRMADVAACVGAAGASVSSLKSQYVGKAGEVSVASSGNFGSLSSVSEETVTEPSESACASTGDIGDNKQEIGDNKQDNGDGITATPLPKSVVLSREEEESRASFDAGRNQSAVADISIINAGEVEGGCGGAVGDVLFDQAELVALRLMFSLFDRYFTYYRY